MGAQVMRRDRRSKWLKPFAGLCLVLAVITGLTSLTILGSGILADGTMLDATLRGLVGPGEGASVLTFLPLVSACLGCIAAVIGLRSPPPDPTDRSDDELQAAAQRAALQPLFDDMRSLMDHERRQWSALHDASNTVAHEAMVVGARLASFALDAEKRLSGSVELVGPRLNGAALVLEGIAGAADRLERNAAELAARTMAASNTRGHENETDIALRAVTNAADAASRALDRATSGVNAQVAAMGEASGQMQRDAAALDQACREIATVGAGIVARANEAVSIVEAGVGSVPDLVSAISEQSGLAVQALETATLTLQSTAGDLVAAKDAAGAASAALEAQIGGLVQAGRDQAEKVTSASADLAAHAAAMPALVDQLGTGSRALEVVAADLAAATRASAAASEAAIASVVKIEAAALAVQEETARARLVADGFAERAGTAVSEAATASVVKIAAAALAVQEETERARLVADGFAERAGTAVSEAATASVVKIAAAALAVQEETERSRQVADAYAERVSTAVSEAATASVAKIAAAALAVHEETERASRAAGAYAERTRMAMSEAAAASVAKIEAAALAVQEETERARQAAGACAASGEVAYLGMERVADRLLAGIPTLTLAVETAADALNGKLERIDIATDSLVARSTASLGGISSELDRIDQRIDQISKLGDGLTTSVGDLGAVIEAARVSGGQTFSALSEAMSRRTDEMKAALQLAAQGSAEQVLMSSTDAAETLRDHARFVGGTLAEAGAALRGDAEVLSARAQTIDRVLAAVQQHVTAAAETGQANEHELGRMAEALHADMKDVRHEIAALHASVAAMMNSSERAALDRSGAAAAAISEDQLRELTATCGRIESVMATSAEVAAASDRYLRMADGISAEWLKTASAQVAELARLQDLLTSTAAELSQGLGRAVQSFAAADRSEARLFDTIDKVQRAAEQVAEAAQAHLAPAPLPAPPSDLEGPLERLAGMEAGASALLHASEALAQAALSGRAADIPDWISGRAPEILQSVDAAIHLLKSVATAVAIASDAAVPSPDRSLVA